MRAVPVMVGCIVPDETTRLYVEVAERGMIRIDAGVQDRYDAARTVQIGFSAPDRL